MLFMSPLDSDYKDVGIMSNSPFLNDISRYMRTRDYSLRTEKTYLHWVRSFIRFHQYQHPKHMDSVSVTAFLDHLANDRGVSINTQSRHTVIHELENTL